jgi:serine phosphatase RsbU (regulator of sigma subunit)
MILGSNVMADESGLGRLDDFAQVDGLVAALALSATPLCGLGADGKIVLANDAFCALVGQERLSLMGTAIGNVIVALDGAPLPAGVVPFVPGETQTLVAKNISTGGSNLVQVRAQMVAGKGSVLVAAQPLHAEALGAKSGMLDSLLAERERREREELEQTAQVAATHLLDEALLELVNVVEADGALFYVSDKDGYRLRARTPGATTVTAAPFMPHTTFLDMVLDQAAQASAINCVVAVSAPASDAAGGSAASAEKRREAAGAARAKAPGEAANPRRFSAEKAQVEEATTGPGATGTMAVRMEDTGLTYHVRRSLMPGFASFCVVPVHYESILVGFAMVGWTEPGEASMHKAHVLDVVAKHVALEIVSSLSTVRMRRIEEVEATAQQMRQEVLSPQARPEDLRAAMAKIAAMLDCQMLEIYMNPHQHVTLLELEDGEHLDFPFDIDALVEGRHADGVAVVPFRLGGDIATWLFERDLPCLGALVDAGVIAGERRVFLVCRAAGQEPLDDVDCTLLMRFAQDIRRFSSKGEARERDTYISQSLQSGMSNHVQTVEGLSIAHVYNSATQTARVGGDFYDVMRLPNRRACIILGDVAGKGVASASVSAAVRTALGAYAWEGLAPAHMVRSLNDFFMGFSRLETFATLFVGIIDLKAATLTYCQAGHVPAIVVKAADKSIEYLHVQSGVVGAFREMTYHDGRVDLHRGDTLLLYTDGVTEARAPSGAFFGEEGLTQAVTQCLDAPTTELPHEILEKLYHFCGGTLDDDVAMLAVRYDALPPARRRR